MRLPCTSTDTRAHIDRCERSLRVGQRAYFGRSKTTLLKNFTTCSTDTDDWQKL